MKKPIAIASAAIIAAISIARCSAPEPEATATPCKFVKRSAPALGPPTSVRPPIIVLRLACCDSDFCVWVDTYSQPVDHHVAGTFGDDRGIFVMRGERVPVRNEIETLVTVL